MKIAYKITTTCSATFAISGVAPTDANSIANTKKALISDAKGALTKRIAAQEGPEAPPPTFEATDTLLVLTDPTCEFAPDASVTRTNGLVRLTVVVTALG
jgi:hypothetical protein